MVFFDNCASPGGLGQRSPRAIPASSPRHPRVITASLHFKIDFLPAEELILVILPPRRPENDISAPFCRRSSSAHVSGRLQGPFWDQFSPQKCSFVDLFSGPVGHICWVIFHSLLATRVLWNSFASGAARKSRIWLATHKNQWIFKIFACARRRRPRSKEGNRGQ